ncbi:MAG: NAD(P)H-dependent oxidoreductase [Spirochaetota bacterium]
MNILLLVCNPKPDSLNHSLAGAIHNELASLNHCVNLVDLYSETFDPRLELDEFQRKFSFDDDIRRYTQLLENCSVLIVVHPDWWGGMPALLHGFLDRVFRPGVAYEFSGPEFGRKKPVPLLVGKHGITFVTSDMEAGKGSQHPLEKVWCNHIHEYCGMTSHGCHILYSVHDSRYRTRVHWIRECVAMCTAITENNI